MIEAAEAGLGTIDAAPAPESSVAAPGGIPYQAITDEELERFNTFLPPIPIAITGVFAGLFLATIISTVQSLLAIGTEGIGILDALIVALNAASLGVAATSALFAYRGRTEVSRMLRAIRRRAQIALPPETDSPAQE